MNHEALERLAATVNDLRPAWNYTRIINALNDAAALRTPEQLVTDAIHAALDPEVRWPTAIPLHHASFSTDPCPRCTAREVAPTAPPVTTCDKCGRQTEKNIDHACVPVGTPTKPAWWEDVKRLTDEYATRIKDARNAGEWRIADGLEDERDKAIDALVGNQQ